MGRPRNNETRSDILKAGIGLFFEKGYDAVTMREIGEAVGMSVSLVQSYYGKKVNILMQFFFNLFRDAALFVAERGQFEGEALDKRRSAVFYCADVLLFYRVAHLGNDRILRLYEPILLDARLLFEGTRFTMGLNADIIGKEVEMDYRGQMACGGAMSQFVCLYRENPHLHDLEELVAQALRMSLGVSGFDEEEALAILAEADGIAPPEAADEFMARFLESRTYFIDNVI